MKINTKLAIKDLKGGDIKMGKEGTFTVGDAVSNILASGKTTGRMKMFILAQAFATKKEVDLDKADLAIVKQAIETTDQYNDLVNGQLLVILEDGKEK